VGVCIRGALDLPYSYPKLPALGRSLPVIPKGSAMITMYCSVVRKAEA
jgi:hypothetical protein